MGRDPGILEVTGFYFVEEHRFIMGLSTQRNPLRWRWIRDVRLYDVVKQMRMTEGMAPLRPES
jgi:hypothetical protein